MGSLKLLVERNLHEDFCRAGKSKYNRWYIIYSTHCAVPDIHIDGTLSALHLMLDKRQLDTIKGLIDMNLGETVEEFEKPSSVILDPVAQVVYMLLVNVCCLFFINLSLILLSHSSL